MKTAEFATKCLRWSLAALALVSCIDLSHSMAATLDLDGLLEDEQQHEQNRLLEEQKFDAFQDPELLEIFQAALSAFGRGDMSTAESAARALIERAPGSPQAWHLLGLALAVQSRVDDAIAALDKAADIYVNNAEPLIVKGVLLLGRGDRTEAKIAFEAASERNPQDWRAQDSLGRMALEDGDIAQAITRYESAAENAPSTLFEPRARLASLYVENGRSEEARTVLEAFVKANPDKPEALVALGRLEFSEGQNDEAARLFDAAIATAPDAPQLRLFKARAELNAGQFGAAETTLVDAIALFPEDAALQLELAGLYGLTKDYPRAVAAFEAGAAKWPDVAAFHYGASRAAYRIENFETALAHAEPLAARPGATAEDHVWHGAVLERLGRTDSAIAAYEKAVETQPDNWIAANNLASLLTDTDAERAVELAERAATASGNNDRVRLTLGWAYFSAGETDRALSLLGELAGAHPDDALFAYRYGRALFESGNVDDGRAELTRAISLDPESPNAGVARALLSAN